MLAFNWSMAWFAVGVIAVTSLVVGALGIAFAYLMEEDHELLAVSILLLVLLVGAFVVVGLNS